MTVDAEGSISDVNILNITGDHTWVSDLTMTLTSPAGTSVVLVETPCSDEDNFLVTFDDNSEVVNLDCPLTTGRSFKPVEELSAFNGEAAAGEWTLTVEDGVSDDGGSLDAWTLELCLNQTESKRFESTPSFVEICDKELTPLELELALNGEWINPTLPMVSTGSGMAIAADINPNPIGSADQVVITIDDPSMLIGETAITISFMDGQEIITANIPVIHRSTVSPPLLQLPEDGADKQVLTPVLAWSSGLTQDGEHMVVVAEDSKMTEIVEEFLSADITITITDELEELTTYFWQVTAIGTCTDSSSTVFSFTTDMKVATIDETLSGIKIFPSPATDYLSIDIRALNTRSTIGYQLLTIHGQELESGRLSQAITNIGVSNIPSGLYIINLISEQGNYLHKIVVQQ